MKKVLLTDEEIQVIEKLRAAKQIVPKYTFYKYKIKKDSVIFPDCFIDDILHTTPKLFDEGRIVERDKSIKEYENLLKLITKSFYKHINDKDNFLSKDAEIIGILYEGDFVENYTIKGNEITEYGDFMQYYTINGNEITDYIKHNERFLTNRVEVSKDEIKPFLKKIGFEYFI